MVLGQLMKIALLSVLTATGCSTDSKLEKQSEDPQHTAEYVLFGIIAGDVGLLEEISSSPWLFEDGKIVAGVEEAFFDGDYLRQSNPDLKSMQELARMDRVFIFSMDATQRPVIFNYMPYEYFQELEADNMEDVLKNGWLKEYFSCAFDLIDGEWRLVQNLCYAGTDGPHSGNYG
jgi:hypothetical protein